MATISQAFTIAQQHHQAGRLQAAEQICRQILAVDSRHADAAHLLGVIAGQVENHALAAVQINLGGAFKAKGQFAEAITCYRRAIELDPNHPVAHNNLGNALKNRGQLAEAIACYRRAIELEPNHPVAHNNLGNAMKDQGQLAEAIACYQRALQLQPNLAEAHGNLGNVLKAQGHLAEAIACYQRAVELAPELDAAHNSLGGALKDQGQFAEAVACFRRAIQLTPNLTDAHVNLGNALQELEQFTEAIACYRRAIELEPNHATAHNNLGNVLKDRGQVAEALACFRQALQLKPDYVIAQSNILYTLHYRSGVTLGELAEAHREFERIHAAPLRSLWRPHDNDRDPHRRLRLGFLSPDLHQHPVAVFLAGVLENLDRDQCATVCYNDQIAADAMTKRLQAASMLWRDVAGQSDQHLAQQIRADRIDILFDLAGHMAKNRLLVFARKPAPVQITWMGYVGTTGLEAMDYLLADRHVVPECAEPYYRERVLRMPDGFLCYTPPDYAPAVSPLPAPQQGHATFGCFNNPAKIAPQVIEVWANILRRVPGSRLVLKFRGFDDPWVSRHISEMFSLHGVEPSRIELLGWSVHKDALEQYSRIDLALDPFPYSGGTITCDTLWMGVPVISCPGETFASRISLSHLSNIRLIDTIAGNLDDYVERAVSLAGDLPRLAAMRAGLREQMTASPLCDGQRFAANLMLLLRDVWRQWVEAVPQSPTPNPQSPPCSTADSLSKMPN